MTRGERIVFVAKPKKWRQKIRQYTYQRYFIVIPRNLAKLLDKDKQYKITLEPIEDEKQ